MGRPLKDYTGQRIGRLTVVKLFGRTKRGAIRWECLCDCGKTIVVEGGTLTHSPEIRSCGCYQREQLIKRNTKHNSCFSKTYNAWDSMKKRCLVPTHKAYKDYGGRGITVCEEWLDYNNFVRDMGEAPSNMSLDRIDNDKGYYKDNCKWSTQTEQMNNRRCNVKILWEGNLYSVQELERITGIKTAVIYYINKTYENVESKLKEIKGDQNV